MIIYVQLYSIMNDYCQLMAAINDLKTTSFLQTETIVKTENMTNLLEGTPGQEAKCLLESMPNHVEKSDFSPYSFEKICLVSGCYLTEYLFKLSWSMKSWLRNFQTMQPTNRPKTSKTATTTNTWSSISPAPQPAPPGVVKRSPPWRFRVMCQESTRGMTGFLWLSLLGSGCWGIQQLESDIIPLLAIWSVLSWL